MKMLVQGCKTIGLLTLLAVIGFGLGGTGSPRLEEEKPLSRAILKVCMGCTYGSIQAAVDAAQSGDTIEVYPPFLNPWPLILYNPMDNPAIPAKHMVVLQNKPAWGGNVVVSKPLTLEAKFADWKVPQEIVILGPYSTEEPIFDITAESGPVVIRGFTVVGNFGIRWSGKADLVLEHNRFQRLMLSSYQASIELGGGPARAQLIGNEVEGSVTINGADVHLRSNRIKGSLYISGMVESEARHKDSKVLLEQNFIEGSVQVEAGSRVRLEDNLLIGGTIGLLIEVGVQENGEVWSWPIIIEANRNIIVRYQKGVAIGYNCDDMQTVSVLQLSGQDNLIGQNGEDLCPADYPWPPGFRK